MEGIIMLTKKDTIINRALEILEVHPEGIRYSRLAKLLIESLPEISGSTIHATSLLRKVSPGCLVYEETLRRSKKLIDR